MAQQQNKLFNLTPNKSQAIQQSTFFQKGYVSQLDYPQKIQQNYQFSYETMPKVNCHYHQDQYITMFCRSQTCMMPLCPHCVKIHSQEHQSYNTYGEFDTLENCLTEVYQQVANHCNKFVDELGSLGKVIQQNEGIDIFLKKVKQARQQCYQVIDNFFNTLEAELVNEVESNKIFMNNQSTNFSKYLQQRWKTQMSVLEKLRTDKCVKSLVKYYTSNLQQENEEYYHESNQFMKQFNKCIPEVIIDQSALYELNIDLAKYISLRKIVSNKQYQKIQHNNDGYTPMQVRYSQPQQYLMPMTNSEPQIPQIPSESSKQFPVYQMTQQNEIKQPDNNQQIHPYLMTPPKVNNNFY